MSKINKTNIDDLNATLELVLEEADYMPDYKSALKKYQKEGSFKGFRPGKAPMSFVKKMFGGQAISKIVNDKINETLYKYLDEEKLKLLGNVIPSESEEPKDYSNLKGEMVFKFDLGLEPEFELQGIDEQKTFEKYILKPTAKEIDEEINKILKQRGTQEEIKEGPVSDDDIVAVHSKEQSNGKTKRGGVKTDFEFYMPMLTDKYKKELLTKKVGDKLVINVFELEKEASEKMVRKHILNLEDETKDVGPDFEIEIKALKRTIPAEFTQELFDEFFGPGIVDNEKDARAKIEEPIIGHYASEGEAILYKSIQDYLLEKNSLELPEAFLKRWLKVSQEEPISDETIEKEFPAFIKGMKWSLIRKKLVDQFKIEVTYDDIKEGIKTQYKGMVQGMQGLDDKLFDSLAEKGMEDQETVQRISTKLLDDKVFENLQSAFTIKDKKLNRKKFDAVIKEIVDQQKAEAGA